MVTKSKARANKGKVKVGKLKVNKETVKDLTADEKKQIKGGRVTGTGILCSPPKTALPTQSQYCEPR